MENWYMSEGLSYLCWGSRLHRHRRKGTHIRLRQGVRHVYEWKRCDSASSPNAKPLRSKTYSLSYAHRFSSSLKRISFFAPRTQLLCISQCFRTRHSPSEYSLAGGISWWWSLGWTWWEHALIPARDTSWYRLFDKLGSWGKTCDPWRVGQSDRGRSCS